MKKVMMKSAFPISLAWSDPCHCEEQGSNQSTEWVKQCQPRAKQFVLFVAICLFDTVEAEEGEENDLKDETGSVAGG